MDEKIKEINILDELFSNLDITYQIPLYQRAFEWKGAEIEQLIDDIDGINLDENINYFLGSIIVSKRKNYYEIIDGQQRLTALYLLFNVLGIDTFSKIGFEGREKANRTLEKIKNNQLEKINEEEIEKLDSNILEGKKIITQKISQNEAGQEDFRRDLIEKLGRVILYRIEVPEHTNLNRYFEIMNTRGTQLEQQDVVKASLMGDLKGSENESVEKKREAFNMIWTACSDMNCYVQTKFNVDYRKELFGLEWNSINWSEGNLLNNSIFNGGNKNTRMAMSQKTTIDDIVMLDRTEIENKNTVKQINGKVRFESIITFPYFLLHVLRIYAEIKNINGLSETLDDKKLIDDFKKIRESFLNKNEFATDFIEFLLKSRILFDKYFIKREFVNDDLEGEWSLKEIKAIPSSSRKSSERMNNFEFIKTAIKDNEYDNILMLQACCRVSYTSPKSMNWIKVLLFWLCTNSKNGEMYGNYLEKIEQIVREACKPYLQEENYDLGVATPHIIFNYLDYLLWKENESYKDFKFEYRNSVEHWYPQHPIGEKEGGFEEMTHEEGLDNIGNLCLVSGSINSKFSNIAPSAKKETFKDLVKTGSLKLRKMAQLTEKIENMDIDEYWKKIGHKIHEEECIKLLKGIL